MSSQSSRPFRIIITRSKEGNAELAVKLRAAGMTPIEVETISVTAPKDRSEIDSCLTNLASYDWLVFTSAVGVSFFSKAAKELSLNVQWEGKPAVAAVGKKTEKALAEVGIRASFVPSESTGERLGRELPTTSGTRALLLRTSIANEDLPGTLRKRGFTVKDVSAYTTAPVRVVPHEQLSDADAIIFASPSAVRSFCGGVSGPVLERLTRLPAGCIGPVTGAVASEEGFRNLIIPAEQSFDRLIDEIRRAVN